MNKKLLVLLSTGFLIVFFAIFLIFKFGLNPKTTPIIKPSEFHSQAQLGEWVYRQLRPRFVSYPIIFLGIENQELIGVIDGIKAEALRLNEKIEIDNYFLKSKEEFLLKLLEVDNLKVSKSFFLQNVLESTLLYKKSLKHSLEKSFQDKILSINIFSWSFKKNENCPPQGLETEDINCLKQKKFTKKVTLPVLGSLEMYRNNEFVVLVKF